jgi:ribosomal protein L31E
MAQDFKEKTITINLKKVFDKPVTKRAISGKNAIKSAVEKETRISDLKISNKLNELIWGKGKYNVPRKITIKVIKEKTKGIIMLPEEKYEPKQDKKKAEEKKVQETKKEEKAPAKEEKK